MLTHNEAKAIVDSLVPITDNESKLIRYMAWHETKYGSAWKPGQGDSSHNMGAITTTHPDNLSFEHKDSKFNPRTGKVEEYTTFFAGYSTDYDGFSALKNLVLQPDVRDALSTDDWGAAIVDVYNHHYFMGLHSHDTPEGNAANVNDYFDALSNAAFTIAKETEESVPGPLDRRDYPGSHSGLS
jgi:hypothetical protein